VGQVTDFNSEPSVSPNSYPVNLHLLRKYSRTVGTANKVSTNSHVKQNKEWALKLRSAIDSTRDIRLGILNSIDVPLDRTAGARDRVRVKAGRERSGRIINSAKRDVLSTRVGPVNRTEVSKRVLALNLHDVDLAARRPADRADAVAEHPERRPDSLTFRRVDARFDPRVDAERLFALRLHSSRSVLA